MIPSDALATGKKLLEKATKGPWEATQGLLTTVAPDHYGDSDLLSYEETDSGLCIPFCAREEDAEFIAWSREGVAQLIGEIERLTQDIGIVETECRAARRATEAERAIRLKLREWLVKNDTPATNDFMRVAVHATLAELDRLVSGAAPGECKEG